MVDVREGVFEVLSARRMECYGSESSFNSPCNEIMECCNGHTVRQSGPNNH
jgi:hypothetical protein